MSSHISKSRAENITDFILGAHKYIGMWALGAWIVYANHGDRLENAPAAVLSVAVLSIMLGIMTRILIKWTVEFIRWLR